jgi:hypothetical protein
MNMDAGKIMTEVAITRMENMAVREWINANLSDHDRDVAWVFAIELSRRYPVIKDILELKTEIVGR